VDWALAKGAFEHQTAEGGDPSGKESDGEGSDEDGASDDSDGGGRSEEDDSEVEEGLESGSEEEEEGSDGVTEEGEEGELKAEREKSLSVLDKIIAAENGEETGKKTGTSKKENKKLRVKDEDGKEELGKMGKENRKGELEKKGGKVKGERMMGEMSSTVFVRGLHLDVSKQELQLKLSRFGGVRSCRLVVDKITGKLKGTAFVEFEAAEAAERCAGASKVKAGDKRSGVTLNGTPLLIDVALTQDGARNLATQRAEAGGKADKRNLHLVSPPFHLYLASLYRPPSPSPFLPSSGPEG
jgi:nucleolar protein 4